MEDNKRKQDLEDEMTRFEQEIASNLPPPPPKHPQFTNPPNSAINVPANLPVPPPPPRPPYIPPEAMGMRKMAFPGPPPVPPMFMDALPPMPVPPIPPLMVPPLMPPMMPPRPNNQERIAPPTVPLKNYETLPSSSANADLPDLAEQFPDPALPVSINPAPPTNEPVSSRKKEKKKIIRVAGGTVWEDPSLLDWDTNDFRIFVGDLGNEVSDDALLRAFSKYPSLLKAKVIRDKKTKKTKGYGFVSFKEPQDYLKAMREMNGKYVGNRPVKLRKSSWKERNIGLAKKKEKEKKKLGLR